MSNDDFFKAYIVLYTCAATRAVILEVVSSLNTINFVQSLRRFKARRGCPKLMVSDNGTSFVSDITQNFAAEILLSGNLILLVLHGGVDSGNV